MNVARGAAPATPGAVGRRTGPSLRRRMETMLCAPAVRLVVRRMLLAVVLLFVVTALTFVLVSLTPGDAARQILGLNASPSDYVRFRHQLGLDRPIYEQYWNWFRHAVTGDLGTSLYGPDVTTSIASRLPVTLWLVFGALLVMLVAGVSIGVFSAVRGGLLGRAVDAFALAGFAIPSFWLGVMLIMFFAVQLRWFPATGYVQLEQSPRDWLLSLALPVTALSMGGVAAVAKQTREAMLDALGSECIRMAWANGISPSSIFFRHALKTASIRVVTVLGVQVIGLLGDAVVIESVFALPGVGSLAVTSSIRHDLPMVQGVVVYYTIIVVLINLIIDLAYTWLNPKVRVR